MNGPLSPRAKKSLGQNFLVSRAVAGRIVDALDPAPGELVVEIGPGRGAITVPIAARGARVLAVELDGALAALLRERLPAAEIVEGDVRAFDIEGEARARGADRYLLAGNIPYHLTSPILLRLPGLPGCRRAAIMLQREVGERILASPGSRNCGILTVFLGSYLGMRRVARVRPGAFRPRPGVESVVLAFEPLASPTGPADREGFLLLLKGVFSQRRKMLRTALAGPAGTLDASIVEELGRAAGVDLQKRPEALVLEEWAALFAARERIAKER